MDQQILHMELRKRMEERLREWMPNNDDLVTKEMNLFNRLMDRRDFLKTSSIVAASALLNNGCGNNDFNSPPSQWGESTGDIGVDEQVSVSKASKIIVDSDIMDGMKHYHPLPAAGSDDTPEIKNSNILESFNPHIMTIDSNDTLEASGFNPLNRNYGIPEYIHLNKDDDSTDYYLAIYEKSNIGYHGLKENIIQLEDTASLHINSLVTANGNFHNQVLGQTAYSQKMVLLANTDSRTNPALRLYYQTGSSPVLQPGVKSPENNSWSQIDIIDLFNQHETEHPFINHSVVEVNAYNDGSNHNFIYGTIQFDDFYNYGFIATFNNITDTQPSVTFFAPEFLSFKSDMINALNNNFTQAMDDAWLESDTTFSDFSIFANQRFIPLTQMKDTEDNTQSQVLFSFLCFDTSTDKDHGMVDVDGDEVDLDHFADTDSSINKRYLIAVDTSNGGVTYPLSSYSISPSITIDEDTFTLVFDTSTIPTMDIWKNIYNPEADQQSQSEVQFNHTFIRSIENDGSILHILMATSFYDTYDLGVTHKSVKINYDVSGSTMGNFSLNELHSVDSKFDTTLNDSKGYKELWFNDMKSDDNYATLAEYVYHNNGVYDFYCTHTHQGLLRSYYIVHINDSQSFLIGFNEQGENPDGSTTGKLYDYQTQESLYESIVNNSLKHYPPLPISINSDRMFRWHNIAQDSEVLYASTRAYVVDKTTRTLLPNDGSQTLLCYNHASTDPLEGNWATHVQEKQIPSEESLEYQYKVTSHQVHLHINNIYDYPATLSSSTYVELRFSKSLIVTDHSDVNNPMTYHVGRLSSIFLVPDESGRISLDINAGANKNDIFKGATMMYRFLDSSDLSLNDNEPVAVLSGTSGDTTEFQQCNISFKQFERLSSDSADAIQPGAPSTTKTAMTMFNDNVIDGQADTISSFTDAYGTLHENSKPDNDTAALSIRNSSSGSIDPLVYIATINTEQYLTIGGIWDKIVKWIDKAIATIANVVNSVVHLAEELAKSIKDTVSKLVDDIETIISKIGASLANVITQIAAAFEKILSIIISIAELIWDFIKALVDMDAAWDIGQEFKQLFYDQFSPDSNIAGNAYSIIESETSTLENKIDGIATYAKDKIDNAIDTALGYDLEDDPSSDANKQLKDNQQNSTKHNYLNDQVERLSSAGNVSAAHFSSALVYDSDDTVEDLIESVMSKLGTEVIDDIENVINDSMATITGFVEGKPWNEVKNELDTTLKTAANSLIDVMDILLKGTIDLPLSFLNGSTLFNMIDELLDSALKPVFELLGLLLFQDSNKFTTLADVAYFIMGYFINLIEVFLGGVLSVAGDNINIPEYIKSGDLRKDINALGGAEQPSEYQLTVLPPVLPVSNVINRAIRTPDTRGCPQNRIGKIWSTWSPLVLSGLRVPSFINHFKENPVSVVGVVADWIFVYSQLSNFWRLQDKGGKTSATQFYIISTVAWAILDLIEAAETTLDTSAKIKLSAKSIIVLQAAITATLEESLLLDKQPCVLGKIKIFLSVVVVALNVASFLTVQDKMTVKQRIII